MFEIQSYQETPVLNCVLFTRKLRDFFGIVTFLKLYGNHLKDQVVIFYNGMPSLHVFTPITQDNRIFIIYILFSGYRIVCKSS